MIILYFESVQIVRNEKPCRSGHRQSLCSIVRWLSYILSQCRLYAMRNHVAQVTGRVYVVLYAEKPWVSYILSQCRLYAMRNHVAAGHRQSLCSIVRWVSYILSQCRLYAMRNHVAQVTGRAYVVLSGDYLIFWVSACIVRWLSYILSQCRLYAMSICQVIILYFESVQIVRNEKPCRSGHRQSLCSIVRWRNILYFESVQIVRNEKPCRCHRQSLCSIVRWVSYILSQCRLYAMSLRSPAESM